MKTVGGKLLSISQSVAVGLLQFVGSIVIAGFLSFPRAAHRRIYAGSAAPGLGP